MKITDKLSRQGLRTVDDKDAEKLKAVFADEVISHFVKEIGHPKTLSREGYFIGKDLLRKLLLENKDAAGIMISFAMDDQIATGGQIQLIIEPASGEYKDDVPVIMKGKQKYGTVREVKGGGPDGATPLIKPKPPQ